MYEALSDSRWVGGEGGYVEEEVHGFLVSFGLDVLVFVDSDGNVKEVDLTTDLFEVPLEFAKFVDVVEEVFPGSGVIGVMTINPNAKDIVDLAFEEDEVVGVFCEEVSLFVEAEVKGGEDAGHRCTHGDA